MASWHYDVADLVVGLRDVHVTTAHDRSPCFSVGPHQFARLRWDDDGRELLQTWNGDLSLKQALKGRRDAFPVVHVFLHRVSTWAVLELLDRREVAAMLLDSYVIRGGKVRARRVDEQAYFARV